MGAPWAGAFVSGVLLTTELHSPGVQEAESEACCEQAVLPLGVPGEAAASCLLQRQLVAASGPSVSLTLVFLLCWDPSPLTSKNTCHWVWEKSGRSQFKIKDSVSQQDHTLRSWEDVNSGDSVHPTPTGFCCCMFHREGE